MLATVGRSIKIMVIDYQVVVRRGLSKLIESWPEFMVVGEAGNREEALALATQKKPDIVLLELDLGRMGSSLEFLPELVSTVSEGHIIILTGVQEPEAHYRAMRLGAMGVVLKQQSIEKLHHAILKVHAGALWLDHRLTNNIITQMLRANQNEGDVEKDNMASLTKRELEVVALVGEGLHNKTIAERLFISETTVHHHLTSAYSKLDVSNRFELIIFLQRHKQAKLPR
jgi:two-component system, NarL family, nitrate/nitrite response regulator NarL